MKESFKFYNKKSSNDKEKNEESFFKRFMFSNLIKALIIIVIFLGSLIYIRQSDDNKALFKKFVYNNSLSFAKIYNLYNKYLGDFIPFKNSKEDETKVVTDEKITYQNITKENEGYMLSVANDYAVASIKSGIVIEKKEDEKYNTMIKVQDKEGLVITYGMLDDIDVKLYDYVKKGEILGNVKGKLYLIFEKDDKYLSYEKYL